MKIRSFADVKVKVKTGDILRMNVIYKLTFPSGRSYIGQTQRSLNDRLYQHCYNSFNKSDSGYHKIKSRAIRKYMEFSVDILYQGSDLQIKEIEFIKEYNTFNNGYNLTLGGDGRKAESLTKEVKEERSKARRYWKDKEKNKNKQEPLE
jgi:hypothetical protein